MPFVSKAQQRFAHTPTGSAKFGGPKVVKEFDSATAGNYQNLPERKGAKKPTPMADMFKEVVSARFK